MENEGQVFYLLMRFFPQQITNGRIMHAQMTSNLTLTVSMLEDSQGYPAVSFRFVFYCTLFK